MSIEIIKMLIPKSNTFTRPGIKRIPKTITIHETDNTNVRANARAHALLQYNGNPRQASWHLQVDDEKQVYQSIPFDEVAWAAGDGANGPGNKYSIHIEICVNKDGNYSKAVGNTIKVVKYLLDKYPSIKTVDIKQHYDWSKKNCPRNLRSGAKGINWNDFLAGVKVIDDLDVEAEKEYTTTNLNFNVGDKVRIKQSAKTYATGQRIPKSIKGKTDIIMQRGSNRILLKNIYSWVKTSDLELVEQTDNKPTKPKKKSIDQLANEVINGLHGDGAARKKSLGSRFSEVQKRVNEILLGSKTTSEYKPISLKVGSKVKIKTSAKNYSRANVAIPNRFKNKTYTVQQVSTNDVLIKELYSWVRKIDLQ